MKKLFIYVLAFVSVGLLSTFIFMKFHFTPRYSGKVEVSGLKDPVQIYYDDYGVPHIEAQSRADLYRAFGYAVMQDRYFQIQMQKLIGSGRLSEWFGDKTLETDKTLRTIGIKHYTTRWFQRNKSKINPDLILDLEAWLAGVNECVKKCPRPLELVLLKAQPNTIEIEDVLAFSGIMSFSFTRAYFIDSIYTRLAQKISPAMMSELTGLPTSLKSTRRNESPNAFLQLKSLHEMDPASFIPHIDGSQSWVVAPSKSASGFATLANDPHIGYSNPGVWYEAHLKSPDFELYGHFVPLIPIALIGHNVDKAWSLTMSYGDELDLLTATGKTPLTERRESIAVKGQSAVELKIQDSPLGPVIDTVLKSEQKAIMYWHYFRDDNFTIEAFYDLAHATKISEFFPAIDKGRAPGLNVSWADKDGNIAWKMLGYFPKRRHPHWQAQTFELAAPLLNEAQTDQEIPHALNPPEGYILSANQRPPVHFDEAKISGYWESSERYDSLKKDLDSVDKVTLDFQKAMFMNNNLEGAADRLKRMLEDIKSDHPFTKTLSAWNGKATLENRAQGFYYSWIDGVMADVLRPYLSAVEQDQLCSSSGYWKLAIKIIDQPQSEWWGGRRTEILRAAFEATLVSYESLYGEEKNWTWGRLHTVTYEHPMGKVKPLDKIFNIGPYPAEGGYLVPNAFRHKLCSGNFSVTGGASTRRLIDFKNPREAWGILPTGNSGSPFSKHYRDQALPYLQGEFRSETMDWNKIRSLKDKLELR